MSVGVMKDYKLKLCVYLHFSRLFFYSGRNSQDRCDNAAFTLKFEVGSLSTNS
jgi:hypothetical protein